VRSYEEGPVVRICKPSQVAATSKALGLPVVSGNPNDPFHHMSCGGCGGQKTSDDCPYSVRIQAYVDSLPYPPSQGGPDPAATDTRPYVAEGGADRA
jgi:hypothetical protein